MVTPFVPSVLAEMGAVPGGPAAHEFSGAGGSLDLFSRATHERIYSSTKFTDKMVE